MDGNLQDLRAMSSQPKGLKSLIIDCGFMLSKEIPAATFNIKCQAKKRKIDL